MTMILPDYIFPEEVTDEEQIPEDVQRLYALDPFYDGRIVFINSATIVLSLLCNIWSIRLVYAQKTARTTFNATFVSIAVVDILLATLVTPASLVIMLYKSTYLDRTVPILCKLKWYMNDWGNTIIIYSIIAMIADRYCKTAGPKSKNSFTLGRFSFFLNFVWFFGAAYNVWEIIFNTSAFYIIEQYNGTNRTVNSTVRPCLTVERYQGFKTAYVIGDFCMIYLLPIIIAAILYSTMVKNARKRRSNDVTWSKQRKAGKYMLSVLLIVIFYLTQLPRDIYSAHMYFTNTINFRVLQNAQILEVLSHSMGPLNAVAFLVCVAAKGGVQALCGTKEDEEETSPGETIHNENAQLEETPLQK